MPLEKLSLSNHSFLYRKPSSIAQSFAKLKKSLGIDTTASYEEKKKIVSKVTHVSRHVISTIGELAMLPVKWGLALFAYFKPKFDPKPSEIKHNKTPILLLHGTNFNETEWVLGRQFLKKKEYGSVFSLNYDGITSNNPKSGIDDYAKEKIRAKVLDIKKLTGSDEVILIGHSMGGLIAGYYAENVAEMDNIKVKHVITIASPWHGAPIIDYSWKFKYFARNDKRFKQMSVSGGTPEDPHFRVNLVKQALNSEKKEIRKYYNIWSRTDIAVPKNNGCLTESPERQCVIDWSGHVRIVAISETWKQTCGWVDQMYPKKNIPSD